MMDIKEVRIYSEHFALLLANYYSWFQDCD